MAYTFARDDISPIILPSEERSYFLRGGRSLCNLLRLRQSLGQDASFGGLFTDRRFTGGGSGSVLGMDGSVRFLRNLTAELQVLASRTDEGSDASLSAGLDSLAFEQGAHTFALDGETYWGEAIEASIERSGRILNADLELTGRSPTFRAANGFITRNDYREASLKAGPSAGPSTRHRFWDGPGTSTSRPI